MQDYQGMAREAYKAGVFGNTRMKKHTKYLLLLTISFGIMSAVFATAISSPQYIDHNQGQVQFDVSMPIDATGYTLHGKNLKGGDIKFIDNGTFVAPLLAHEKGNFELPTMTTLDNKPLIKTNISYNAIKLIDPIGINNLFIKVGIALRKQTVSGLDPTILKDGTYTWWVPIFAVGTESNDVNNKSQNLQLMEVTGIDKSNSMYTQQFYLYTQGSGNTAIAGHPITTPRLHAILPKAYTSHYTGYASADWTAFGDPVISEFGEGGPCSGTTMTFPGGPNLDYEYGTFQLPTMHTPWTATPSEHCLIKGKQHSGCVAAKMASGINYIAQKIRVPINDKISLYAEFGSVYRNLVPNNIRIVGKNFYVKKIVTPSDYLKTNFLPGGYVAPYFAVGYEFQMNDTRYSARYIYIPLQENSNRLAWGDAPQAKLFVISVSTTKLSRKEIRKNFNDALNVIRQMPAVYEVLGKSFFISILKKNDLYEPSSPPEKYQNNSPP